MSWWNAKYKNDHGEYEITFGSQDCEKTKAVEKLCHAIIDKRVKMPKDVAFVVRCWDCKHYAEGMAVGMCKRDPEHPILPVTYNDYCSRGERKENE